MFDVPQILTNGQGNPDRTSKFGYEIYPMELINAGEEFYATMRRSTNGGGENSPKLSGEDDMYELFMVAIERGTQF